MDIHHVWNDIEQMTTPYLSRDLKRGEIFALPEFIKRSIKWCLGIAFNGQRVNFLEYEETWMVSRIFNLNALLTEIDNGIISLNVSSFVNTEIDKLTALLAPTADEFYYGIKDMFNLLHIRSEKCISIDIEVDVYYLTVKFYCIGR
jgi:hypothetical protein